jgi:subtilisin family serine protease
MESMFCFAAAILLGVQDDGKIDQRVLTQMENRGQLGKVGVFIAAEDQVLTFGDAFAGWTASRADEERSDLRKTVLASLKSKSSAFVKVMNVALPNAQLRPVWVVNGIAANLTTDEIKKAAASGSVKYIYPAGAIRTAVPSGTVSPVIKKSDQKAWSLTGKRVPWNLKDVGAENVWKQLKITGRGSVVAVLDGGVIIDHPDLKPNIWINDGETPNNGKDDDRNGYIDDLYGYDFGAMSPDIVGAASRGRSHGTMTSGITAGAGVGGIQTGVAPGAKLMPLKAGGMYQTFLAYQYALENGADVISMSFSIPNLGNTRGLWRLMCEHSTIAGLLSVSGAGNFQQSAKIPVQQRIPEAIPCVLSAGGVNQDLTLPRFVSLGPVEWASVKFYEDHPMPEGLVKPDVSGYPGAGYPVLDATAGKGYVDPNNRIRGNSFSCPHAAGTAALMLSANPELPAWRVREIMMETAADIAPPGKDNRTGAGLIDALAAVKKAIALKSE